MFYYLKKIMVQFYSFWFVNEDTLEYPVTFCLFFFFYKQICANSISTFLSDAGGGTEQNRANQR